METQKLAKEIALLERQKSQTKNATLKAAIEKKVARLKLDLEGSKMTTTELARKLLSAKQGVQRLTAIDFSEVIKRLSKKPEYHFLKRLTKQEIKDDLKRVAKPVGYRFRGRHNYDKPTKQEIIDGKRTSEVYYENRSNRSDVIKRVQLKTGGNIPNNYAGKTPQQIWDAWTVDQRKHFLTDHMDENYPMSTTKQKWDELIDDEKDLVAEHIVTGQYKTGGAVKDLDNDSFLKYAHKEISDFLKKDLNTTLDVNWSFKYEAKRFTIDAFIRYDEQKIKKLKNATFTIHDSNKKEVGVIDFDQSNEKKPFTPNSKFFEWHGTKFETGGVMKKGWSKRKQKK